jgi:signal transduction histidine kinase
VAERTAEAQWRANQLQKLAAQMTEAEERERRRLSQVLHDGLQQVLVAANLRLSSAARRVQDAQVATTIKEAANLIDESIAESRSLTKELSPPVLYDGGLAAGLEWLGRETEKKYQLPVTVMVAPEMEPDDAS